jgi:hypothetical protein
MLLMMMVIISSSSAAGVGGVRRNCYMSMLFAYTKNFSYMFKLGSHLFVVVTFGQYYICVQLLLHLHPKPS